MKSFTEAVATIFLVSASSLVGCNSTNLSDKAAKADGRAQAPTAVNDQAALNKATGSLYTTYIDGRQSEVRVWDYYNFYRDTKAGSDPKARTLILVAIEWDRFSAIIGDKNSAFAQLPNNQMVGGSEDINAKTAVQSEAFFKNAQLTFTQRMNVMSKIDRAIPNRNIDSVSFDFITNQGVFTVQQPLAAIKDGTSPWSALFKEATALREDIVKSDG